MTPNATSIEVRTELAEDLARAIAEIELPEPLGFARVMAPIMASAVYRDGGWDTPRLTGLEALSLVPHTQAVHYGQVVFEGMKAYRNLGAAHDAPALLFRPYEHAARFNRSALRLGMPEIDQELFAGSLEALVVALDRLVPGKQGQSLYLRPLMMGTTAGLSVVPSSEYRFLVMATPSDAFFTAPIATWIERRYSRAGAGGTGNVKAAGNYAASFAAAAGLGERGFQQLLWLDAAERRWLEEFSAMNLFVRRGDILVTPSLTDTILPGVTRDSLIRLAGPLGLTIDERPIEVAELVDAIRSGEDVEVFGCGTGVVISSVTTLGDESGMRLSLGDRPVADFLRQQLLDIQHGIAAAPDGWQWPVPRRDRPSVEG